MVMWSDPLTRTPASGRAPAYFLRMDIKPGISCSAMVISLRPQSAREGSATLQAAAGAVEESRVEEAIPGILDDFRPTGRRVLRATQPAAQLQTRLVDHMRAGGGFQAQPLGQPGGGVALQLVQEVEQAMRRWQGAHRVADWLQGLVAFHQLRPPGGDGGVVAAGAYRGGVAVKQVAKASGEGFGEQIAIDRRPRLPGLAPRADENDERQLARLNEVGGHPLAQRLNALALLFVYRLANLLVHASRNCITLNLSLCRHR